MFFILHILTCGSYKKRIMKIKYLFRYLIRYIFTWRHYWQVQIICNHIILFLYICAKLYLWNFDADSCGNVVLLCSFSLVDNLFKLSKIKKLLTIFIKKLLTIFSLTKIHNISKKIRKSIVCRVPPFLLSPLH